MSEQPSKPVLSGMSSKERAKAAVSQLLAFYPAPNVGDLAAFAAGAVALLAEYQPALIDRIADPVRGIPSTNKFFPNLAELREWLEGRAFEVDRLASLSHRYVRDPAIEDMRDQPPARLGARRSELCKRYGVPAIPNGWDAVDMAFAKARHGEKLAQEVSKAIEQNTKAPPPPSVFSKIVENARRQMERRQGEAAE